MTDVGANAKRSSNPPMSGTDNMADIARKILVKCENAKNDETNEQNNYIGNPRHGENSFGDNDNHSTMHHIVFVTGCSVTFTIEINGLTCESDSVIAEPYININKEDALNWLRLLGYKEENLLELNNESIETSELINDSNRNDFSVDSTELQTNMSETTEEMSNIDELDNYYVELNTDDSVQIKQEPMSDEETNCENSNKRKSSCNLESDKYLFKKIKVEKICEKLTSGTEVINQKYDQGDCGVGMEYTLTVGSELETLDRTDEQEDVGTADVHEDDDETNERKDGTAENEDGAMENEPSTTDSKRDDSNRTKHTCTICALVCNTAGHLERHCILIHNITGSNIKPLKCELCHYRTASSTMLELHMIKHTSGGKLICEYCSYTTKDMGHFHRHTQIHTENKPYKCTICDYSSAHARALKRHGRIHTKEKPFKCTHEGCTHTSSDAGNMKVHEMGHTGARPHQCSLCPYAAREASTLRKHMRTHTNERPYKCTICPHTASARNSLVVHMRTHTKEKPYKCSMCSYAASESVNLKSHERTHTKDV